MKDDPKGLPLRLKKKHGTGKRPDVTAADGERLVRVQSLRGALLGGLVAILAFSLLWIMLTGLLDRVFPWMTVVLGAMVGYAVQRAGRGVDWRFPVTAAVLALVGALLSNVLIAASTTAASYGTNTLSILRSVTSMTWPVFFDEVWTIADAFYAVLGASVAAFLANRRLSRRRTWPDAARPRPSALRPSAACCADPPSARGRRPAPRRRGRACCRSRSRTRRRSRGSARRGRRPTRRGPA